MLLNWMTVFKQNKDGRYGIIDKWLDCSLAKEIFNAFVEKRIFSYFTVVNSKQRTLENKLALYEAWRNEITSW